MSMKTIFMGTPEFAVPSLQAMIRAGYTPSAVVTGPDRPRGRGQKVTPTPVKREALKHDLRILQPESVDHPSFVEQITDIAPEIIAVVAYKILPPDVFRPATTGAFNLHASLLPAFRGAAPINRAIMEGATETGVTTFLLQEAVDTGPVLLQKRTHIGPNETAGELHDRLKMIGATAVVETIQGLEEDTLEPIPQDDSKASYASKLHREECRIPWQKQAQQVHNHIRGVSPYPGAWTMHEDTVLKMYRSEATSTRPEESPGTVVSANKELLVACGEGCVAITELQQPGGSRLNVEDFLNGYALREGDRLE
jgi:methionyl-tRNA formyltransferase